MNNTDSSFFRLSHSAFLLAMSLMAFLRSRRPFLDSLITGDMPPATLRTFGSRKSPVDEPRSDTESLDIRVSGSRTYHTKEQTVRPLWMPSACAERLRLPVATILDYCRRVFKIWICFHLSHWYWKFHHFEGCFRNCPVWISWASGVIEVTTKRALAANLISYGDGSFGIATVYKNLKMLPAGVSGSSWAGISILIWEIIRTSKGDWTDRLPAKSSLPFMVVPLSQLSCLFRHVDRQGVIWMRIWRISRPIWLWHRKIFVILSVYSWVCSVRYRKITSFRLSKDFYSAATFNPTFPNHKNTGRFWDQITTSQITNPLAWMEVKDHDATSHQHPCENWHLTCLMNWNSSCSGLIL